MLIELAPIRDYVESLHAIIKHTFEAPWEKLTILKKAGYETQTIHLLMTRARHKENAVGVQFQIILSPPVDNDTIYRHISIKVDDKVLMDADIPLSQLVTPVFEGPDGAVLHVTVENITKNNDRAVLCSIIDRLRLSHDNDSNLDSHNTSRASLTASLTTE